MNLDSYNGLGLRTHFELILYHNNFDHYNFHIFIPFHNEITSISHLTPFLCLFFRYEADFPTFNLVIVHSFIFLNTSWIISL